MRLRIKAESLGIKSHHIGGLNLGLTKWQHIAGIVGVIAVIGWYNSLFAFSFLPLTEGWFSAYAHLILMGKVPYRDFYLYLTPFYPMAMAAVTGLLGDSFFVLRLVGVIMMMAIAVLLYLILAKQFRPTSAMLSSIVATIYYQSGVAHIPYDFTQVLTLFTLSAAWMLVQAGSNLRPSEAITWKMPIIRRVLFAGLFASLAFLTKQSNGAFVVIGVSLSCLYLAILSGHHGWKLITAFSIGCLVPVIITLLWLIHEGALSAFWEQIFSGALAAKGSLSHVLFSWLHGLLTAAFVMQMKSIGIWAIELIVVTFIISRAIAWVDKPLSAESNEFILLASLVFICLVVVVISYKCNTQYMCNTLLTQKVGEFATQANNYIIPVATTLSFILLILGVVSCFIPKVSRYSPVPVVILGIVSVGMIWGNGTSAGLSEVGVFAVFSLALAIMMDSRLFRFVGFAMAIVLSVSLIYFYASKKFNAPYSWWGVKEPTVREAMYTSTVPIASGLKMSLKTSENLNALADALSKGERHGDIFAFPNIPIVYLITNRWPHSKVVVPWFDFLPDAPARAEAARLLTHPPATIVNLNLPPVVWKAHERLFRDGKPLGQRAILAAITELTEKRKLYSLDYSRAVSSGCVLDVWNRKSK